MSDVAVPSLITQLIWLRWLQAVWLLALYAQARKATFPQEEMTSFTYNDFRREAASVNERGFTKRYFFDANGVR